MTRPILKAGRQTDAGYTYATVLVLIVSLSLAAQASWIPAATNLKRADEQELLHRGEAYARAIQSYYSADPAKPEFPPNLEALLSDPRAPERRHIRRLYDPVVVADWQLIPAEDGGVSGVVADSGEMAMMRLDWEGLPAEQRYKDWKFLFVPG